MSCASGGNIIRFVGPEKGSTARPESRENDAPGRTSVVMMDKNDRTADIVWSPRAPLHFASTITTTKTTKNNRITIIKIYILYARVFYADAISSTHARPNTLSGSLSVEML